jgi:hypothetical protein
MANTLPSGMRLPLVSFRHNMTKTAKTRKHPPRTATNSTLKSIEITQLAMQIGLACNIPRAINTITCDDTAPTQKNAQTTLQKQPIKYLIYNMIYIFYVFFPACQRQNQ